ncbi:MAG: hypothetical protein NC307_07725 [Roseburia sp.]|nr:hypothetical protein [Roseburia sp.]
MDRNRIQTVERYGRLFYVWGRNKSRTSGEQIYGQRNCILQLKLTVNHLDENALEDAKYKKKNMYDEKYINTTED